MYSLLYCCIVKCYSINLKGNSWSVNTWAFCIYDKRIKSTLRKDKGMCVLGFCVKAVWVDNILWGLYEWANTIRLKSNQPNWKCRLQIYNYCVFCFNSVTSSNFEGAALTNMAVFLRCQRVALLTVAFCFLPFITSSLHLEDPNVCSHWERWVSHRALTSWCGHHLLSKKKTLVNMQSIFWMYDLCP